MKNKRTEFRNYLKVIPNSWGRANRLETWKATTLEKLSKHYKLTLEEVLLILRLKYTFSEKKRLIRYYEGVLERLRGDVNNEKKGD